MAAPRAHYAQQLETILKRKTVAGEQKPILAKQNLVKSIVNVYEKLVKHIAVIVMVPQDIGKKFADDIYAEKEGNLVPVYREALVNRVSNNFKGLIGFELIVDGEKIKTGFDAAVTEQRKDPIKATAAKEVATAIATAKQAAAVKQPIAPKAAAPQKLPNGTLFRLATAHATAAAEPAKSSRDVKLPAKSKFRRTTL